MRNHTTYDQACIGRGRNISQMVSSLRTIQRHQNALSYRKDGAPGRWIGQIKAFSLGAQLHISFSCIIKVSHSIKTIS